MKSHNAGFPFIDLQEYNYDLPRERIAQYPLDNRDHSRLLVFKDSGITHHRFHEISELIPANSTLFFNDTRVIPARIMFQRKSGAWIEVFLLEPLAPSPEIAQAMAATGNVTWKCMIGNLKKWKDEEVLELTLGEENDSYKVSAELVSRENMEVKLTWDNQAQTFSHVLEESGKIPLPPYITRDLNESDLERYQTVYSQNQGAVAAPTAGLHFTNDVLRGLESKGIKSSFLTLHVSSGTFQPIKSQDVSQHPMHAEQIVITQANVEALLNCEFMAAVGTTSMRTIESIYWYGVQLEGANSEFNIKKDVPYQGLNEIPAEKAFSNVLNHMRSRDLNVIHGVTEIFIVPGYNFKTCDAIVTNFHIPGSTLMLLIAAFIGQDWRDVYKEALRNDYRFLSYGDSSLLFKGNS